MRLLHAIFELVSCMLRCVVVSFLLSRFSIAPCPSAAVSHYTCIFALFTLISTRYIGCRQCVHLTVIERTLPVHRCSHCAAVYWQHHSNFRCALICVRFLICVCVINSNISDINSIVAKYTEHSADTGDNIDVTDVVCVHFVLLHSTVCRNVHRH